MMTDFIGDGADNLLDGTDFADRMEGRGGDDTLLGRLGKDLLTGDSGNDKLYGSSGRDTLQGGQGNDLISDDEDGDRDELVGGDGDDTILGAVRDDLQGGLGTDSLALSLTAGPVQDIDMSGMGPGGSFTFIGGTAISGFELGQIVFGFGDDRVVASGAAIVLSGNSGADTLIGGAADDTLNGGFDFDKDVVQGGGGADVLSGGLGDRLDGGGGEHDRFDLSLNLSDVAFNVDFAEVATGGAINVGQGVRIAGFEGGAVVFGDGDDKARAGDAPVNLDGYRGNDTLLGGAADNTLSGGAGDDLISGGGGTDLADYRAAFDAVTVKLGVTGYQDTGAAGMDRLLSIENLLGSQYGDTLRGDAAANRIDGNGGADTLSGGDGDDTLLGGESGQDRLAGGLGRDRLDGLGGKDFYVFTSLAETTAADPDVLALEANDVIQLKDIDANAGVGGDQAFHIVSALSGAAGELAIAFNGTLTSFLMDVDGDGTADARIVAAGDHTGHTNFQL